MSQSSTQDIEGKNIKSEDFSRKSLEHFFFTNCKFSNCNFSESLLYSARFVSCIFTNCNLSLVKLDGCRIQDVQFVDCKIIGAEFFKCEKTFFSLSFKNCILQCCNFSDLNMKNFSFCESKITENYFTNVSLQGADFNDVDLSGTTFHNCDLSKANLSTATRYDIDPRTNKITKAKFSLPEAVGLLRAFDITIV